MREPYEREIIPWRYIFRNIEYRGEFIFGEAEGGEEDFRVIFSRKKRESDIPTLFIFPEPSVKERATLKDYREGELLGRRIKVEPKENYADFFDELSLIVLSSLPPHPFKFTSPLREKDAKDIFSGLFRGEKNDATLKFAPPLGLSTPDNPHKLSPENSPLFPFLTSLVDKGVYSFKELQKNFLLQKGIPKYLSALLILSFIPFLKKTLSLKISPEWKFALGEEIMPHEVGKMDFDAWRGIEALREVKRKSIFELPDANESEEIKKLAGERELIERTIIDDEDLLIDKKTLLKQLEEENLTKNPHLIGSLKILLRNFKRKYMERYKKHHTEYTEGMKILSEKLNNLRECLRILKSLDSIEELGKPVAELWNERLKELERRIKICEKEPDYPICECGITLLDRIPEDEFSEFEKGIKKAIREKTKILSRKLARKIIERGEERIDKLLKIIRSSEIEPILPLLDDEILSLIKDILKEEIKIEVPIFDEMRDRFKEIGEENIEDILSFLEEKLKGALKTAKEKEPSKRIKLILK